MDAVLSAVATDLVGRLIAFLVWKYEEPGAAEDAVRLRHALLRAGVVVEEAEGRQIASPAMLLQLHQLRREMCRGAYALDVDAIRWRAGDPRKGHATAARRTPFSRLHLGTGGGLSVAVESLEAALSDIRELVVLLGGCPRVDRQPYSAYLLMESCMFGRQMEKEQIIGFLLRSSQDLDVLPVLGPCEVGKRTLVEHVCLDERVSKHFAKIHRLSSDHEHHLSLIDGAARSLIVFGLDGGGGAGEEEERWRRLHASVRGRAHAGSKIILISRAAAHAGLGTAPPLRLCAPRREELWYFFRALAFGGADPEGRPELLRVAMALFACIHDPAAFAAAGLIAASLRVRAVRAPRAGRVRRGDGLARGFPLQAGEGRARRAVHVPRPAQVVDGRGHGAERAPRGDDGGPGDRRRRAPPPRDAFRRAGVAVSHPSVRELRRDVRRGESSAGGGRREEASSEEERPARRGKR